MEQAGSSSSAHCANDLAPLSGRCEYGPLMRPVMRSIRYYGSHGSIISREYINLRLGPLASASIFHPSFTCEYFRLDLLPFAFLSYSLFLLFVPTLVPLFVHTHCSYSLFLLCSLFLSHAWSGSIPFHAHCTFVQTTFFKDNKDFVPSQ